MILKLTCGGSEPVFYYVRLSVGDCSLPYILCGRQVRYLGERDESLWGPLPKDEAGCVVCQRDLGYALIHSCIN